MKIASHIAGGLLGLLFLMASLVYLLKLAPDQPAPPEGTPAAAFMAALAPTGYLTFVKICELLGGILVVIPRTRNLGLLMLGPIIVNIVAFHVFITGGEGVADPMLLVICALALFLLWTEREAFGGLVK
ncbi:MAG: DoxX family protein [Burkholderiales bacterium]|nr:DoxX family protein [Opitutaceae bacterium]